MRESQIKQVPKHIVMIQFHLSKHCISPEVKICEFSVKGVLHPSAVFGLFLHISQKQQHIGDK